MVYVSKKLAAARSELYQAQQAEENTARRYDYGNATEAELKRAVNRTLNALAKLCAVEESEEKETDQ